MKIGLIGWYGHDNAGDERILYCIKRFLNEHQLFVTSSLQNALENLESLNQCDYVLFGGGGLVLRGWNVFTPLIEQIKPRFGCIGISVEARNKDNLEFIQSLQEKSDFILVRDKASRELFDNHPKVIVGPDLTFLYPFDVANQVNKDVCGLNLRPWYFWKCEHSGSFYKLMVSLTSQFPSVERFYPFDKWQPDKLLNILSKQFAEITPIPMYLEKEEFNDSDVLRKYFGNSLCNSFSLEQFYNCRYLVGMRLHSVIFACQMGIPFLALLYQPKNKEFCTSLGLEQISIDLYHLDKLLPAIEYIKYNYQDLRQQLLHYRNQSHLEIQHIMKSISNLIFFQKN